MPRVLLIILLILVSSTLVFAQGTSIATATPVSPSGSASSSMNDNSHNDYWKVTTTANGYLRVQINSTASVGSFDVDMSMFDVDGAIYITGDSRLGSYSEAFAFLKPGTYYIYAYRGGGTSGSYTITNTFASPSRAVDAEPNDSPGTALSLNPTGISTGYLGFYGSGSTDLTDYWKIRTTQDGWLRVQIRNDSLDLRGDQIFDVDMSMYDTNGTIYITGDSRTGTFSQAGAFLRPGTYYIRTYRGYARAGSYEIKSDFFPPPRANDVEGNDSYQTATPATVNGTVTGHLGYYSNGTTDAQDYWKFTIPGNGKVVVKITNDSLDQSGAIYDVDFSLFDTDGATYITGDSRTGTYSEATSYLKGGTYYVRAYRGGGNAGSYAMAIEYTVPPRADDGSGNETPATAKALTYNVAATGHLGYYGSGTTNSQDYWRLVAPASDSIYIHILSDAGVDVDFSVYASDGTAYITGDSRTGTYSQAVFKATAGAAYYVRAYRGGGNAGSYVLIAQRSSVMVGIQEQSGMLSLPIAFTLEQNYPNPFNPTTTILYGIPESQNVRITIFSLLGQEVAELANTVQSPGSYRVVWNGKDRQGKDVPSGIYLIRLQAGNTQLVKKAMLVR